MFKKDVFKMSTFFFNGINEGQYFILIGTNRKKTEQQKKKNNVKKCHDDEIYLNLLLRYFK